ncbi:MAG TPA: hypothetical protein P5092_09465 [Ruminococcus sp.]|nr:hypothetical protein [Ruminococcus sp.]
MWKFLVKNQSIEIMEREVLADHQIQYVQFKFTFDGDWKHFHKVVQFSQCDEVYSVVLGTDGTTLYLPAELHAGVVKMSVFGYNMESDTTVRATTVPVTLNIRESGFEGDDPPIPPTPDLYTQLLKRIEDAEHGLDGKSAYEIAVEHGYVGTEEEWLASLHGKDGITPDMSEYPKTSEVTSIVETVIAPMAADAHTHDNKAALDSLTPELFTELYELQQFEDQTKESLHTLKESVDNFSNTAHTHENKAVLDKITQEMLDDMASIATVVGQAHWHHNLSTLNGITESHVTRWNDAYTTAMNLTERVGVNEGVFERFKTEILYDMQGCRTSISDILNRLSAVETELSGVEDALAAIVEVTT